ncbi:selenium metabolism-associated LysR family transcriptional regulator [Alkaliphilus serpentinus]|uniref:LysR family transcriptional regulator n=1 Tax=Alkaliphilus serpentinus TaxID=1482731 RepID=A0A833HMX3_9FIRM|nr:selenium metabolism-associated LysR family transcriptional regulator [Alkaliphilus serpentinus]KAB3529018.1 LysR family transcriptional regulator [Alkaliphilus serpentinus]
MDFRQLESFVMVAKHKSFSKAADYLYLTQPTISSHILNLEKDMNTILINRSNRKISLTKAGEILYEYAVNLLNLKEDAVYKLNQYKGKIVGSIEIAASTIPEQYILPQLMSEFNKEYPDVTFRMLHYDSQQVVEGILQNQIDFGIVGAKVPNNQLNYVELIHDEVFLITPATGSYANLKEPVSLQDILDERFIFREMGSGTRKLVDSALRELKLDTATLNVIAYIENTEAIKECIRHGLGLSFLSKRAVVDEIQLNVLRALKVKELNLARKFYFVYHKYRNPSPLEATFQTFVSTYFNK